MAERYLLQKSTVQEGWWVLTDTEVGIVCRFREHEFNKTQKVTPLDDDCVLLKRFTPTELATILRGMGDWLSEHHYDIAMA